MYKNSEGYADPTAGSAMSQIMKEYRQKQKWLKDHGEMILAMAQND